jgi:hypothetical protein
VDTIADTIRRAVDSEVPRLVRAADKVQDLIDQLEHELAEHELGAELRAEAAKLEARLAEIRGQIGGKRAAAPTAPARRADTKAIRAWAATHGVECADRGRIPQTVVDAYESRPEQIQGAES